jgi:hypothetical protein
MYTTWQSSLLKGKQRMLIKNINTPSTKHNKMTSSLSSPTAHHPKTYALLEQPDTMPTSQRLELLSHSVLPLQRLTYVRLLSGDDAGTKPDILKRLQTDKEWPIREGLMLRIAQLVTNQEEARKLDKPTILDITSLLLRDDNSDVRNAAIYCVGRLAEMWGIITVLPICFSLTRDGKNMTARITGAAVLGELASATISKNEMIWQILWPELTSLALEDIRFQVRKVAIASIPRFVNGNNNGGLRILDEKIRNNIVDVIERASTDAAWPVRKCVATILGQIGHELLCIVIASLAENDPSAYVKTAALQSLGNFIGLTGQVGFNNLVQQQQQPSSLSSSSSKSIPSTTINNTSPTSTRILNLYMITLQPSFPEDEKFVSVFSFPGVIMAFPSKWNDTFKSIHNKLAHDSSNKIRRCIVASMNEIANSLGETITRQDLFPLYLEFLQDFDDEVRVKAVEKWSCLMNYWPPEPQRVNIFTHIELLRQNALTSKTALSRDVRFSIASQLGSVAKICKSVATTTLKKKLLELFWACSKDEANHVRNAAMSCTGDILAHLDGNNTNEINGFCSELISLAKSKTFQHRLLYISAMKAILQCKEAIPMLSIVFDKNNTTNKTRMLAALDVLKNDQVWNVKNEAVKVVV